MKYYAGLDVSVKETSVCIVDEKGKICRERKVVSHPDDLASFLSDPQWHFERVGLEAGPLSQWLYEGLAKAGFPAICIETRHTKAFLKAQPNKTDRNDARGIAQMMRVHLIDDGARRWPNRFAGIRGDNRHSGPIPILAGGWSCSRIDADSQPVGRE